MFKKPGIFRKKKTKKVSQSEIGLSLKHPVVVTSLDQEYEFIRKCSCTECKENIPVDFEDPDRLSWVFYKDRVHDVLRYRCTNCDKIHDFYFDFTPTVKDPETIPFCIEIKIADPIPKDIFASVQEKFIRKAEK